MVIPSAVVNSDTKIGKGYIINTESSVDYDNILDDFVHISVGCHTAGMVYIGKGI